jgi:hypothetical protein
MDSLEVDPLATIPDFLRMRTDVLGTGIEKEKMKRRRKRRRRRRRWKRWKKNKRNTRIS